MGTAERQQRVPRHDGAVDWEPVDGATGDLLTELADVESRRNAEIAADQDAQWDYFRRTLRSAAAERGGELRQNDVREQLRGHVDPRRIGPFYNRAQREGWLTWTGRHEISTDHHAGNAGRPVRVYRLTEPEGGPTR